ncbi:MAG: hypothetical protein ACTHQQ_20535 [Solirubrobacteraceae bacterium]
MPRGSKAAGPTSRARPTRCRSRLGREHHRGERVVYLGRSSDAGSIGLRECQSDAHAVPYDRYTVGIHDVAFAAESRAVVDDRARWVAEQGMTIESGREKYGYEPGYYAVFLLRP